MKTCSYCDFYGRPVKARLRVGRRIYRICLSCKGAFE